MTELLDIYDVALNRIGVKSREAAHRDGDWHQVFHCWVIGRDAGGEEYVILQQRGPNQDSFPGKIDISAAGHLEAGETVRDGVRELQEELGLIVDFDDLIPLGIRLGMKKFGELIDCQICHVFLFERSLVLAEIKYSAAEVAGLLKLRIDDGIRLLTCQAESVEASAVGFAADRVTVAKDDFIPSIDNYPLKVLLLAKRFFAGERYLLV